MASELIQLRAQAKKAGIPADEFKGLGIADLKALIKSKSGSAKGAPAKGAVVKGTATKGAATKGAATRTTAAKGAPARKPAAKPAARKPATKTAPAKSTARKPAATRTAAKGTAKRPSSVPAKKAPAKTTAARKPAASKAPARKQSASAAGRNLIDNSAIDWTAEWNGGQSGNRQIIIKQLRKFKGNTDKVFNALAADALSMFPRNGLTNAKRTKAEAEKQLRWMISRVKLDFVVATGQHEMSTNRAGYGESTNEAAVERRKQTLKNRKALGIKAPPRGRVPNAAKATQKPAARKTTAKPAPKRATPQKPAQRRTATTTRKPAARKPVARKR